MPQAAENVLDINEAAPAPPPTQEPVPVTKPDPCPVKPWGNLCRMVNHPKGMQIRWCGKRQELPVTQSFWLHPGSNTWVEQVPNVFYPSLGAAMDAAYASPEPPGWK